MKTKKNITPTLAFLMAISLLTSPVFAGEESLSERMLHHRAIDAAVWAMPLMNYKAYRDALIDAGVKANDIGYYSKVQDWKFQTATPNNTTPYIVTHWTVKDGPIVVEIPPATKDVAIFGTLMDAWQRPMDDVGGAGRDKGRGAKYLLVPEGYTGPLLPGPMVPRSMRSIRSSRQKVPLAEPRSSRFAKGFGALSATA
jgi:hypothetical protein